MMEVNGLIVGLVLWIAYSWVLLQLFSPRDSFVAENLAYGYGGTTITVECRVVTLSESLSLPDHRPVKANRYLRSPIT
ncbi:hypothetical protein [Roseofilum sp. Guam]|uniref:hypothetical protein n=1 Tax=Roseofilum sp. Guam TaxID=2821502 RepID=UPI001B07D095|nr:hypothetical protein [Roseofilum sp. Guam]MBP0028773.1 hypothetical protein [Roseofilum sp. Guam]